MVKRHFANIRDKSGDIQGIPRKEGVLGEDAINTLKCLISVISSGIEGHVFKPHTGEVTIKG